MKANPSPPGGRHSSEAIISSRICDLWSGDRLPNLYMYLRNLDIGERGGTLASEA